MGTPFPPKNIYPFYSPINVSIYDKLITVQKHVSLRAYLDLETTSIMNSAVHLWSAVKSSATITSSVPSVFPLKSSDLLRVSMSGFVKGLSEDKRTQG